MSVFEIGFYEFLLEKLKFVEWLANAYLDNAYILNVFLRFRGFHSKEP